MKKRFLLVEDEAAIVKMTQARLEYEGFEVCVATDGEAALQQVKANGPLDLILMDVKLPKLDGFEVSKRLKADPATATIPIIIFTASSVRWDRLTDQCLAVGASDWLRKPFRSTELLEKIHRVLSQAGSTPG